MVDLIIKNGIVVTPDGEEAADVLVQNGNIAGLVSPGTRVDAAETLDATGLHVLPGVIDPHTHLPNRGRTYDQSCDVFSRTQVSGGTTSAISFIFTNDGAPESSYIPALQDMAKAVREHSIIDMGAAPIIMSREHIAEMPMLVKEYGISSFKVFMDHGGRTQMYPKTWSLDDGLIWLALKQAASIHPQPIVCTHAENVEICLALGEDLRAAGRKDAAAWTEARPNVVEEDSLRHFAFWVEKSGATGYAVHLTTKEAPKIVAKNRGRGVKLYGETCPHYLTCYDTHPQAKMAKYQPAIKHKEDTEALWAGIRSGAIQCTGSDHIPVTLPEKFMDQDIWGVSLGTPSSGTILPVLLSYGVNGGRISLPDVVRVSSYNVARILGLYPQKGNLLPGAEADIVLVDMKKAVEVTAKLLNADFTLYEGERFRGWPRMTLLRGRVVCEDGQITVPVSGGRELRRRLPEWTPIV